MARFKKGPRITVSLPQSDHDGLLAFAEKYDVSLSWLTRQAISEFLNRYRGGELQLPLSLKSRERKVSNG